MTRTRWKFSGKKAMSQQLGARGDDRDQHQGLERLRCNFVAHLLSDVHAELAEKHRHQLCEAPSSRSALQRLRQVTEDQRHAQQHGR